VPANHELCTNLLRADYAIALSFGIVGADGSEVVIAKQEPRSVTTVRLPAGSALNSYVTTVRAVITDVFGARASVDFNVTVRDVAPSAGSIPFPACSSCLLHCGVCCLRRCNLLLWPS